MLSPKLLISSQEEKRGTIPHIPFCSEYCPISRVPADPSHFGIPASAISFFLNVKSFFFVCFGMLVFWYALSC